MIAKTIFEAKDDVIGSPLFANDSLINNDILEKISKKSDINIEISNINITVVNINIPKLNIA